MKILLVNQSRDRVPAQWIGKWARGLSKALAKRKHKGLSKKELVIVFVTSPEMRRMNKTYRGKDYATDVLSFESLEEGVVGELVLCLPILKSQAKRTGLSERGELGYMIVHGVLHLLGYDHEVSPAKEAEMFGLQDEIFRELEKSVGMK